MASSRAARRKRRRAAILRKYKRLRREGRLPVHSRAERRREAKEREQWRGAEPRKAHRIREAATAAVAPTAIVAVVIFVPHEAIPLHKTYKPDVVAEVASGRDSWSDGTEDPHTELREVMQLDPFVPTLATASPYAGEPYPNGGVNPHPDGWERYRWLFHYD